MSYGYGTTGGSNTFYFHMAPPRPVFDRMLRVMIDDQEVHIPITQEEQKILFDRGMQYEAQRQAQAEREARQVRTVIDAVVILERISGTQLHGQSYKMLLRRAQRKAHPDTGGSKELFQQVGLCEGVLKREGKI